MAAPPKDGLVVLLASEANFSSPLLDLDRETAVLRGFPSCPRDFKRTSVERHFRAKGFALDWCEFRLLRLSDRSGLYVEVGNVEEEEEETQIVSVGNHSTTSPGPPIEFPTKDELPLADLTFLYIQVHSVWFMEDRLLGTISIFYHISTITGVMPIRSSSFPSYFRLE